MKKALIAFTALVALSTLSIATVGCGQATPKSKMTAIQVVEYANKRLADSDTYEHVGASARGVWHYQAVSAKYLTEGITIKQTYLKPGTWLLDVQARGEAQLYKDGKWVTISGLTTLNYQYSFDENTATLEEIK
ncbi:MAG: hypothetical protein HY730_09235 [Candidatus Tectomicrobia bacterium]|uniref:Lipoprotein n=1 Tax=Tectimicrobiota bacterium TaxID=2528274 RepID=A0A933GMB4_UNCTE|nr:hypothetical protein [Candidatus Tectomicrobia bacterium]